MTIFREGPDGGLRPFRLRPAAYAETTLTIATVNNGDMIRCRG